MINLKAPRQTFQHKKNLLFVVQQQTLTSNGTSLLGKTFLLYKTTRVLQATCIGLFLQAIIRSTYIIEII